MLIIVGVRFFVVVRGCVLERYEFLVLNWFEVLEFWINLGIVL